MASILATLYSHSLMLMRVMGPAVGVLGVIAMAKHPHLGAITDADGGLNLLPIIVLGCLLKTLVMLLRMK